MTDVRSKRGYLSAAHPLAAVARDHCDAHGVPPATRLGRVACGRCWERAIRDDEHAVVVFGLPRELVPDPTYVDEIAVERVLAGERIELTAAERRVAAIALAQRRMTVTEIAERLETRNSTVRALLDATTNATGDPEPEAA